MDARQIQEQASLFSAATRTAREIEVLRHAAIRARDEAIAQALRHFFSRVGQGLSSLVETLRSWPDRRQTFENLRNLSDRELADIGLTRGEISRVFEPDFRKAAVPPAPAKPATAAYARTAIAANGNTAAARNSAAA